MKIILLGSSPAMLLQALILYQKYKNIEIHESKKSIGGSWKTSNFFDLKNVETGTHILAPWKNHHIYKESLKILKNKIGLNLYSLDPTPKKLSNKNLTKKELKKIKYYYVKGGANKIIKNLSDLIKRKKIKIITNSAIKKIKFINKKKLVYTNKKFFFADKIFLPYYCNFDKDFLIENDINFEKKKSIHLLIKFLNLKKIKKKFSYIQHPIFSKWVDRSSALSKHILLKNTVLFCTRLSNKGKREYNKNSTKLAKFISIDVLNYLNEYNFTNTQKINIKFKFYEYETSYRDNEKLKKLKKFTNRRNLNLVDTSEFMKYIGKNLSDLKKLKNYVKKSR